MAAFAVVGSGGAMVADAAMRPARRRLEAIVAVHTAWWDIAARLVDRPGADLLGGARDTVPVYGSGGFTTYHDLCRQRERWVVSDLGASAVKDKAERRDDPSTAAA